MEEKALIANIIHHYLLGGDSRACVMLKRLWRCWEHIKFSLLKPTSDGSKCTPKSLWALAWSFFWNSLYSGLSGGRYVMTKTDWRRHREGKQCEISRLRADPVCVLVSVFERKDCTPMTLRPCENKTLWVPFGLQNKIATIHFLQTSEKMSNYHST